MKKIIVSLGVLSFGVAFGMPNSNNFDESKINSKRSSFIMYHIQRAVSGIFRKQDDSLNESEDIFYDCKEDNFDLKTSNAKEGEGKNNQLISKDFFNVDLIRIQDKISKAFDSVTNKNSDSKTRAKEIVVFIQKEFDWERVNAGFHSQMTEEVKKQELEYHRLLEEKDKEIEILQKKLNKIFHGKSVPADLIVLEEQRKNTEKQINELRNNRQEVIVKDPLKAQDVQETVDNVDAKMDKLMNRVKEGRMSLEDATEDTKEYLSEQIKQLGKQLDNFRIFTETELRQSHKREIDALREAYDRQVEIMQQMVDASENLRIESEKEGRLKFLVLKYLPTNSLPIRENIKEIKEIEDIHNRIPKVQALYDQLNIVRNVLAATDLGLKASVNDLDAIKTWLDKVSDDKILKRYGPFDFLSNIDLTYPQHWDKTLAFNGSNIGKPLYDQKDRLIAAINDLKISSERKNEAKSRLLNTFKSNVAETSVAMTNTYCCGNYLQYHKNGQEIGFYEERSGRSNGIFSGLYHGMMTPLDIGWERGLSTFKKDLNATVEAIKHRARLIFDFETNPLSKFQECYQLAGISSDALIPFPQEELDRLINQYNEFIKMTF